MKTAPMAIAKTTRRQTFPDEEGIETFSTILISSPGLRRQTFPDEEGIETQPGTRNSTPVVSVDRRSPMKRGLRLQRIPATSLTRSCVDRRSPMKRGLRLRDDASAKHLAGGRQTFPDEEGIETTAAGTTSQLK